MGAGAVAGTYALYKARQANPWIDPVYAIYANQGQAARQEAENAATIAKNQAAVEQVNAGIAKQQGELEAEKRSRAMAADVGSLYANYAGNGLLVDGSSTGDTLGDALKATTAEGVADISTIKDNSAMEAWTHQQNARNYLASAAALKQQGKYAEKQGEMSGMIASAMTAATVASSFFTFGATAAGSAAGYAALAGTVASGAASAGQAYTSYQQGAAQREQYKAEAESLNQQAKVDETKAGIAQLQGEQEAEKRQRILANDIGSLYANYAGNGLLVDSPFDDTLTNVLDSEIAEGVFDTDVIKANTAMNVWNLQQSARNKRLSAQASRIKATNAYRAGLFTAGKNAADALFAFGRAGYQGYQAYQAYGGASEYDKLIDANYSNTSMLQSQNPYGLSQASNNNYGTMAMSSQGSGIRTANNAYGLKGLYGYGY